MEQSEIFYAQLISLIDEYERKKKNSFKHDDYIYYMGACYALRELKGKIESCYETKGTI